MFVGRVWCNVTDKRDADLLSCHIDLSAHFCFYDMHINVQTLPWIEGYGGVNY